MASLRTLHNQGAPFKTPDGELYANGPVVIKLVELSGSVVRSPISIIDAVNGECIVFKTLSLMTDAAGELSVDLWPNSRGGIPTVYEISFPGDRKTKPFTICVNEGEGSLSVLAGIIAASTDPIPQDLTSFDTLLATMYLVLENITDMANSLIQEQIVVVNTEGVNTPVNILAANNPNAGSMVIMKDKADATDGAIVITPASGTVDDAATYTIYNAKEFLRITPHAASNNWYVTGR